MAERLMALARGMGSILEIWPPPMKIEDVSPYSVTEMVRQSWEETGAALWTAIGEVGDDPQEETASEIQEARDESQPVSANT